MSQKQAAFETALDAWPAQARGHLSRVPARGGILEAAAVRELRNLLGVDITQLAVRLLPLAVAFAHVPVSRFAVGAVAAGSPRADGEVALYLGANLEVAGAGLGLTVHAEQAAVVNAWMNGEIGLSLLAVSATPCGYCRQFLGELVNSASLNVIGPTHASRPLTQLLPAAFGPADLGIESAFMAPGQKEHDLRLAEPEPDPLRTEALRAARLSYAPYTGAFAGCAVQTEQGRVFVGRSVENAAYNPSLAAIQVAFAIMNMNLSWGDPNRIERIVLVERATSTTQLPFTETFARAIAAESKLEYCKATLAEK